MLEELRKFVVTGKDSEVMSILGTAMFAKSLTRNRGSNGAFFFRVRAGQTTIGRSRDFGSRAERDEVYMKFLDWIEVSLHQNYQRRFEFE